MTGIERGIAEVLRYAADNDHGYVLGSGRHMSYAAGTDCAGLMRLYAATVEGAAVGGYPDFGTWNERSVLTARGWTAIGFSKSRLMRGDVLLRALGDSSGHTVLWLGNDRIVGAEGDWDGRSGDGSGTEVCERSYYDYGYNWILRPPAKYSREEEAKVEIEEVKDAVYRLYNASSGDHMFTADHDEAEALAGIGWTYEGVAFDCSDSGEQVYRVYNANSGDHMFTADAAEAIELVILGWRLEGHAWRAPRTGRDVHRLYNNGSGDHHLTASEEEREALERAGWAYEGVAFHG